MSVCVFQFSLVAFMHLFLWPAVMHIFVCICEGVYGFM